MKLKPTLMTNAGNTAQGHAYFQSASSPNRLTKTLFRMKHWGLFFLALCCAACHDDEPAQRYYITLDEDEIRADYSGIQQRIAVSANCDWTIRNIPQWCIIEKAVADNAAYLNIEVLPNDTENPREATITLACPHDRYKLTTADLFVSQAGQKKPEYDPLQWHTFAVNKFNDNKYDLLPDNVTRKYRLSAEQSFVNPAFRTQVYPGHLINCHTDNRTLTVYDQYTYNPINISASINGKFYEKEMLPTFDGMNEMVQQITSELPAQSQQFNYIGPLQYHSHRHLHLLGVGNLGLNLDELLSGKPYTEKEMGKRTGVFYNYSREMFTIMMDYPDKLIRETISEEQLPDMSYITHMTFGQMSLLFVETDQEYTKAISVVDKIIKKEKLSADDIQVKADLLVYYVYFDKGNNPQTVTGGSELIGRFVNEIGSLNITPLGFTTNKLSNNQVGNLVIEFALP